MQVIVPGKRDYLQFLPSGSGTGPEGVVPSAFLLFQPTGEGVLVCSTLTGTLVLLTEEEARALERVPAQPSEAVKELIRWHFLVSPGSNGNGTADQLRALMLKRREAGGVLTRYIILPTTFCNARCYYCYESGIRQAHMSPETARALVRFIAEHHGGKPVLLNWFGGEPLMGRERIDQICGGLAGEQIPFASDMTSNGFLFDPETVRRGKERWHLRQVQITLDGTQEVYNSTKNYLDPGENPYRRVLRNIRLLLEAGVRVDIRLNLGSGNGQDLEELIRELSGEFPDRRGLRIYVSRLDEEAGFEPVRYGAGEVEQVRLRRGQLEALLQKQGWTLFREERLPALRVSSCVANQPESVLCTPDGILGKCVNRIFEDAVGRLGEGITDREKVLWWRERRAFADCAGCPLYPACDRLLAHCPGRAESCTESDRERMRSLCRENMTREYEKWKKAR